jgi:chromosomal replication initiation ATPase DnaA
MNETFNTLVDIVCKHYNADPAFVLSGNRKHTSTTPRAIIATLWSRGTTLQETANLLGWKSAQQVCHARHRVKVLSELPSHAYRLRLILEEVTEKIPYLTAETPIEK